MHVKTQFNATSCLLKWIKGKTFMIVSLWFEFICTAERQHFNKVKLLPPTPTYLPRRTENMLTGELALDCSQWLCL
jgi:hypothetical protein